MVSITRHEEFEVAHILPGHDRGCGRLHGHTYKIEVTVTGPRDNNKDWGMVLDFGYLKSAIKQNVPDHYFVYQKTDIIGQDIAKVLDKHNIKYIEYDFPTTAENMVGYFAKEIQSYINNVLELKDIKVTNVKLWETTNSYAEWSE